MLPIVGLWPGESRTAMIRASAIEDSVKMSWYSGTERKGKKIADKNVFGKDSFGDYSITKARENMKSKRGEII